MAPDGTVTGAAPPPAGVTPNFVDPDSIAHRIIIVVVIFPILCFVLLGLRLWVNVFIIKRWHPDDYFIILAFMTAVANSIICSIQTKYGLGYHMWDIPATDFLVFLKLGVTGGHFTYNLSILLTKLSILSFYLRFSIERAFRIAVYCTMFVTVGYALPNALLFVYICRPMQAYWNFSMQAQATCINMDAAFHTNNTLNMLTDFTILLLPIWMLKPMRAPLLKKIGIMLILMTGGFVCAISLMRMIVAFIGFGETDISWHYTTNLSWCSVEVYVGIICACLPCLRAFAKRYFPNMFLFNDNFERRVSSFMVSLHLSQHPSDDKTATGNMVQLDTTSGGVLRGKASKGSDFTDTAARSDRTV